LSVRSKSVPSAEGTNCCAVRLGSVFRTVLLSLRTLLIWAANLALFYCGIGHGTLGEHWDMVASPVELAGFAVLLLGTLLYSQGCSAVARDARIIVKDIEGLHRAISLGEAGSYVAPDDDLDTDVTTPSYQLATLSPRSQLTPAQLEAKRKAGVATGDSDDESSDLNLSPAPATLSPTPKSMRIPQRRPESMPPLDLNSLVPRSHLARRSVAGSMPNASMASPPASPARGSFFGARSLAGSLFGRVALPRAAGVQSLPGARAAAPRTKEALRSKFEQELRAVVQSGVLDAAFAQPAEEWEDDEEDVGVGPDVGLEPDLGPLRSKAGSRTPGVRSGAPPRRRACLQRFLRCAPRRTSVPCTLAGQTRVPALLLARSHAV
jgi:hypothetical protein